MTRLTLRDELPFITVTVVHRGGALEVENMLVDTGSASTLLNADIAATIGIVPEPGDRLRTLRGVGGREAVFARHVDRVEIDGHGLDAFEIEIGGMDYGFDIGGMLGMDSCGPPVRVFDLGALTVTFTSEQAYLVPRPGPTVQETQAHHSPVQVLYTIGAR